MLFEFYHKQLQKYFRKLDIEFRLIEGNIAERHLSPLIN